MGWVCGQDHSLDGERTVQLPVNSWESRIKLYTSCQMGERRRGSDWGVMILALMYPALQVINLVSK